MFVKWENTTNIPDLHVLFRSLGPGVSCWFYPFIFYLSVSCSASVTRAFARTQTKSNYDFTKLQTVFLLCQILYMASFFFTLNYVWNLYRGIREKFYSCMNGYPVQVHRPPHCTTQTAPLMPRHKTHIISFHQLFPSPCPVFQQSEHRRKDHGAAFRVSHAEERMTLTLLPGSWVNNISTRVLAGNEVI